MKALESRTVVLRFAGSTDRAVILAARGVEREYLSQQQG